MEDASRFRYDFLAPGRIIFGWGRRREVGPLARTLGCRALVVCGSRTLRAGGVLEEVLEALRAEGLRPLELETISHEPQTQDVDRLAARLRQENAGEGDFLLAIGGGAAIDLAKAAAAMATNHEGHSIKDYLENVGRNLKIVNRPLPVLAMPSTAGAGAEATKNAVISSYDPPFKKSLRDEAIVPRIALVDPELSLSLPPEVTAAGGMDAITQLIESFISRKARPIPQALAVEALRMAIPAIAEAVENGASRPAREKMSHAALISGICLANSGLGMAHGVAAALGVHCRAPHGAACAVMLPVALRVNRRQSQDRLARLAGQLFDPPPSSDPQQAVSLLIDRIEALCDRVGVPRRLCQLGVSADQIPQIVKSSRGSSMSGNPRQLGDDELSEILEQLL